MKESYEDIQKLLEQFLPAQEAGQMADDIRQADSLISSVPAAKVSAQTLAAIRDKVHQRLAARQRQALRLRIDKYVAAVAAMVFIAVLVNVFYKTNQPVNTTPPAWTAKIWNDNVSIDSEWTTKLEQVTGQLDKVNQSAVEWLDENSDLTVEVDNLETVAMGTDFWKGY